MDGFLPVPSQHELEWASSMCADEHCGTFPIYAMQRTEGTVFRWDARRYDNDRLNF